MPATWKNRLYFGDNLAVLQEHVPDESVDLVYLDPPFNSAATYNVLFKEATGRESSAQITAFEDTWHWGMEAETAYHDVVTAGGKLADLIQALRSFLGQNDMMAYLTMMAIRLRQLHRVLKPTGSVYLHCDPTASHYLKLVLDAIFGPTKFRTEIIWKRSSAHSDTRQGRKQHGRIHDVLLFYTKGDEWQWNPMHTPYDPEYVAERFRNADAHGRYKDADLTAAKPGGDTSYEWRVKRRSRGEWTHDLSNEWESPKDGWEYRTVRPSPGRYWAYSRTNMIAFAEDDRLHYFSSGMPRLKQYAEDLPGIGLQDLWSDIPPINSQAQERLGYPTQKPEALLERVLTTSSNEGEIVLDPFCGCGTTISVAERLHRRWIGIDVTHLAISLIRHRLQSAFGSKLAPYEVVGDPKDLEGARALAEVNRHQFEWWALSLVEARPAQDKKKGADAGVDGYVYFFDDKSGQAKKIAMQVKSGHVGASQIRDLKGAIEREKAAIGGFITLEEPTAPMKKEAASAGFYVPENFPRMKCPRVQILTIEELLAGKQLDYPRVAPAGTFKAAEPTPKAGKTPTRLF